MEARIWSKLPHEILEEVLAFSPVLDLCRYRAVCKAWDNLITDARFVAHHNAASTSYIVVSLTDLFKGMWSGPWWILDVRARRWYSVGYGKHYQLNKDYWHIMAMDGGLVCQYLKRQPETNAVIVHNPIAKSARVLPVAPDHVKSAGYPMLNLVVDADSATFKVVMINHGFTCPDLPLEMRSLVQDDPLVRIYESASNEWRSMRNPPWSNTAVASILQSIMFQGWLYVLFGFEEFVLRRYNPATDMWETLATPIPVHFKYPKLVVSDKRLFLAAWHWRRFNPALDLSRMEWQLFYYLFEVKVPGMVRETVFEHSMAKMAALFGEEAQHCNLSYPCISVLGFGSCLLFMSSSSGKAMSFDVATKTWDRDWPRNPLRYPSCSWEGKHMNLLLPRNYSDYTRSSTGS